MFRLGAIYQIGGYDNNNGSQGEWAAQIGKDFDFGANGKLSVDAIYTENQGAVKAAALSAAQNLAFPGTLAATISDDNSVMLLAKYTYDQLRVYGGYEYITFANPTSPVTTGFNGIAGIPIAFASFDTSFSRRLSQQAGNAVAYGLPHDEALRAITVNAAKMLGIDDQLGTIEAGKLANIIVTDGDPLEIRTQVRYLFIKGRLTSLENRHTELYEKYRKHP